jgi:predicted esterase
MCRMAHGKSGKIIIEVDPAFKERLYETLRSQGSTMKDWFLKHAHELCDEHQQPSLGFVAEDNAEYETTQIPTT